jgi:hypothetical protein
MFGANEVFVAAHLLIDEERVLFDVNAHEITYVHIMCEGHEIVDADGCMAETFHPGPVGLSTLDYDGLRAMMDIFPELSEGSTPFPLARPELKRREINACPNPSPSEGGDSSLRRSTPSNKAKIRGKLRFGWCVIPKHLC